MKITFLGGARTVTGSMHLIEIGSRRVLLECGLFQGRREEAEQINRQVPGPAVQADFMILSHSHIDHSGNIPNLVKRGFSHEIYQTAPSRDLTELLLLDSAHIQESDIKYVNKKRTRSGLPTKAPIYTIADAETAVRYLTPVPYGQRIEQGDTAFTLIDAGHVLGSAQVVLESAGARLVFSGDLGRRNLPIIRDPAHPQTADYLILESTYGGRCHPPVEQIAQRLAEVVNQVSARGGRIVIPAFALERTQEILVTLCRLQNERRIVRIPVFVDSPLATRITEVFRRHMGYFDDETKALFDGGAGARQFENLHFVGTTEESMQLNDLRQSCIIISASGMAESGRVLHHLRHAIGDRRNMVLIVGFAAEHTLARRLAEQQPVVRIFGEEYVRRAEVVVVDAFSAHADQNDLIAYVQGFDPSRLKQVFLVHGELAQSEALKEKLSTDGYTVTIPEKGQVVNL